MFFPEFLYRLSQRDQQVTWLDPSYNTGLLSDTSVGLERNLVTVPDGRVLILESASVEADPGAAHACTRIRIVATTPVVNLDFVIAQATFAVTANLTQSLNWSGSLLIPPGWSVRMLGVFDAAVAANQIQGYSLGMLLPVGNIQRI